MFRNRVWGPLLGIHLFLSFYFVSGCSSPPTSLNAALITPAVTPPIAYLLPGQTVQFSSSENGAPLQNPIWSVNAVPGGSSSTGTISSTGLYTAPSSSPPAAVQVTATNPASKTSSAPATISFLQPNHILPGTVSPTNNPLVAFYITPVPQGTSAQIQFGTTTNYGLTTWAQQAPSAGGFVGFYVAGMRASTTYHMQAVIQLPDGSMVADTDHTFTTGAMPSDLLSSLTTQSTGAGTPSPGVELLSLVEGTTQNLLCTLATDLDGNVIWYYPLPAGAYPFPIKQLANGHMLLVTGGKGDDIREIDLAGNLIHQITAAQIISTWTTIPSLQNAAWQGLNHDVLALPNGHLVLLISIRETVSNVSGVPDGTAVLGNALIDWDPQQNGPAWTWSTFDHLDLTYAPYGIADWTHGNAVIYSPDDGNLIFSMRNQNWVVKINYNNGAGDGSILWRFGPNGDFALANAPIEWNYGQHYPTILTPNSSGTFEMMLFNNGNNRLVDANNDVCGSPGVTACYSSVPIYQINESAKTASVVWEDNLSPAFSFCCGDAQLLPGGNVEYDVAADFNTPNVSHIQEVTQTQTPELVWQMNVAGKTPFTNLVYRGLRIPSLYPGVSWTQDAMATANAAAAVKARR